MKGFDLHMLDTLRLAASCCCWLLASSAVGGGCFRETPDLLRRELVGGLPGVQPRDQASVHRRSAVHDLDTTLSVG